MGDHTHYIVLVHGTWARRKENEAVWYVADENPDNFCARLNDLLTGSDFEGAIWRHCEGLEWPFLWGDGNSHKARLDGAATLYSKIKKVVETDRGAMIHFVAHSHGGNVVLAAIDQYLQDIDFQARSIYSSLHLLKWELGRQRRGEEPVRPFVQSDTWSEAVSDWDGGVSDGRQ
jgi:hypothetical protein